MHLSSDVSMLPSTETSPLRVVYATSTFAGHHAGTERHLLRLASALPARYQTRIVSLQDHEFIRNQPEIGRIHTVGYNAMYRPHDWWNVWKFARWLREQAVDIIELHSPEAQFIGGMAARLAKVPVVVACRRSMGYNFDRKARWQLRWSRRFVDCYLANSRVVIEHIARLESLDPGRFELIYNGVDLPALDRESQGPADEMRQLEGKPVVAIAANLRPVKNHAMLLRAAQRVLQDFSDVQFALFGSGDGESDLRRLAAKLEIAGHVHFFGSRVPVAPYLKRAAIGCLTSDSEGFSNAILEYMALGLPVVATDVGGAAEAIVPGETGFLVPAGDDQQLAEALQKLLHSPDMRHRMGHLARQRIESDFSLPREIAQYETLYNRWLDQSPRPRRAKT